MTIHVSQGLTLSTASIMQGQGLNFSSKAALNYSGQIVPWMKNIYNGIMEIKISNVSDLNHCYKQLTYEKYDIVKSMELYFGNNSTYVPLSIHWNQLLHPCNIPNFYFITFESFFFTFQCMEGVFLYRTQYFFVRINS